MKKIFVGILMFCLMISINIANAGSVKCFCAEKWQSDYKMQEYCINRQIKASKELFEISYKYINTKKEWKKTGERYKKGFEEEGRICLIAWKKWKSNSSKCKNSYDWVMALYEVKNQLSSYNKIKNMSWITPKNLFYPDFKL